MTAAKWSAASFLTQAACNGVNGNILERLIDPSDPVFYGGIMIGGGLIWLGRFLRNRYTLTGRSKPAVFKSRVRKGKWTLVRRTLSDEKRIPYFQRSNLEKIIAVHADEGAPTDVWVAAASLSGYSRLHFFDTLIAHEKWDPLRRIIESDAAEFSYDISKSIGNASEADSNAVPDDIVVSAIRMKCEKDAPVNTELLSLIGHFGRKGSWQELIGIFEEPGDDLTLAMRSALKQHLALWADDHGVPNGVLVAAAKMHSDRDSSVRVFRTLYFRTVLAEMREVRDYALEHSDQGANEVMRQLAYLYAAGAADLENISRGYQGPIEHELLDVVLGPARMIGILEMRLKGGRRERSYYTVLGLARDASDVDIKRAYRKLARLYHPDHADQSDEAAVQETTERFQDIADAYAVLSDSQKRQLYDKFGIVE